MSTSKIPVLVVAGWLGAGKTSFLNQILSQSLGLKVGALVNDFGEINIDTYLIDQQVDELVSLSNGCLCCTLSNELDDSLNKLTTANPNLDLIVVEASGLADPAQIAELIFNSQNQHIIFQDIIYLIDAANFPILFEQKPQLIQTALRVASIVLINKIDLVGPEQLALIEDQLRNLNPRVLLYPTQKAYFEANILLDQKTSQDETLQLRLGQGTASKDDQVDHHQHHHSDYQQLSLTIDQALDPIASTKLLNNLPTGVYRAKGWLYFGKKCPGHRIDFQRVGRYHHLRAVDWPADQARQSNLVLIGFGFDQDRLRQKFQACIDQHPNDVRPDNTVSWHLFKD